MIETLPASGPSPVKAMPDEINHPRHYTSHPSGVECVTIAEHHNFCIGNVLKYIWRAGLKKQPDQDMPSQIKDLKKAQWYLDREIDRLEAPLIVATTAAACVPRELVPIIAPESYRPVPAAQDLAVGMGISPKPSPESPTTGARCPGDEQPFP